MPCKEGLKTCSCSSFLNIWGADHFQSSYNLGFPATARLSAKLLPMRRHSLQPDLTLPTKQDAEQIKIAPVTPTTLVTSHLTVLHH